MRNHLVAHPSFCFLVACSEVNVYPTMKYFINMDDSFMNFRNFWLRCWLTTPILMIRRMEVHQISEKEKYHTYWRLHLPILTTTIKRFFTYKYRYKQYIYHWPKCKKYKHITHASWERGREKSITLCMLWRNAQEIM